MRGLTHAAGKIEHLMNAPMRVLMVEDSATDAKLVVQELRRTGRPVEFERVESAEAMRAALESKAWDVKKPPSRRPDQ
jgi:CheY-like chemotaxis protein